MFEPGDVYKYLDLPLTNYASLSYDTVLRGGKQVGFSTFSSYSHNERTMLSLGILNAEHADIGTEVTLVVGRAGRRLVEANGGTAQADRGSRGGRAGAVWPGGA